jgi:ankyrin repeat protein
VAFLLLTYTSCLSIQDLSLFDPNLTPEGVRAALDAGADLEARDEDGWTPLMSAAMWNSNPEVLQVLLDAGADATAKNEEKETAWDLIQDNEALKGTKAYWRLNELGY